MSEPLTISIKTLTPIWTGDVNGRCSEIKEIGIIGSLRWWYEAIIRGMGGYACDPTKKECSLDCAKYNIAIKQGKNKIEALRFAGLCEVCQIFGTTGQKRKFNLRIMQDDTIPAWKGEMLNIRPPGRSNGWFLPSGRIGNFTLQIQGDPDAVSCIAKLFLFLEQWGALGAKSQLGYGFFRLTNREAVENVAKTNAIRWHFTSHGNGSELPDLSQWLFFKFHFSQPSKNWWTSITGLQRLMGSAEAARVLTYLGQQGMVPVAPVLKNMWRFEKWDAEYTVKQQLLGKSLGLGKSPGVGDRIKSRVSVSWAYNEDDRWTVRGWAWMPEKTLPPDEINKFKIMLSDESLWRMALNVKDSSTAHLEIQSFTNREID